MHMKTQILTDLQVKLIRALKTCKLEKEEVKGIILFLKSIPEQQSMANYLVGYWQEHKTIPSRTQVLAAFREILEIYQLGKDKTKTP